MFSTSRGLLRNCEIFGNFRITFVWSSARHLHHNPVLSPGSPARCSQVERISTALLCSAAVGPRFIISRLCLPASLICETPCTVFSTYHQLHYQSVASIVGSVCNRGVSKQNCFQDWWRGENDKSWAMELLWLWRCYHHFLSGPGSRLWPTLHVTRDTCPRHGIIWATSLQRNKKPKD